MDALSLLTASVPSYFVIAPLVLVLIVLVALIGKKDTPKESVTASVPSPVVAQAPVVTPLPIAEVAPPVFLQPQTPSVHVSVLEQTPSIVNVGVNDAVSVTETTTTTHESAIPQQPELAISPVAPPVSPTPVAMPPISSWKPLAPTPVAAGDLIGESEGALQEKAVAEDVHVAQSELHIQEAGPVSTVESESHQGTAGVVDAQVTTSMTQAPDSTTPPVTQAVEAKA